MNTLVFASSNKHKSEEIAQLLLPLGITITSLNELKYSAELPETGSTLTENALQKARECFNLFQTPCFADDTGLEIDALNGEPGVFSARYAGPAKNAEKNMDLVLEKLKGQAQRSARFKTVIAYSDGANEWLFEGTIEGEIATKKTGNGGFGYDPIFIPKGHEISFAEMSLADKNRLSHRARALQHFVHFLSTRTKI